MSVLVIPNTFVTGTVIQAAPFNSNFSAVATAVNSIDNTNIGAAGIFASQLIPTTTAQATFGGVLSYVFPNAIQVTGSIRSALSVSTGELYLGGATEGILIDYGVTTAHTTTLLGSGGSATSNFSIGGVFTAGRSIQASPTIDGTNTLAPVPPVYLANGSASGTTMHIVSDTVVAAGGTTTITLSGAAVFGAVNTYSGYALNITTGATIVPISTISGTQFSFASTNTQRYQFFCIGT